MTDKNNLNELNQILFDTLKGVKDGSVKKEEAKVIKELSDSIINNAKVQLDGFKFTKGIGTNVSFLGIEGKGIKAEKSKDPYTNKLEFALYKGFNNLAECVEKMGKIEFEKEFKEWTKNF